MSNSDVETVDRHPSKRSHTLAVASNNQKDSTFDVVGIYEALGWHRGAKNQRLFAIESLESLGGEDSVNDAHVDVEKLRLREELSRSREGGVQKGNCLHHPSAAACPSPTKLCHHPR